MEAVNTVVTRASSSYSTSSAVAILLPYSMSNELIIIRRLRFNFGAQHVDLMQNS